MMGGAGVQTSEPGPPPSAATERLLVLMPGKLDAERTVQVLCAGGVGCMVCGTLRELCHEIKRGAGAALLTEETLLNDHDRCLDAILRQQPAWSNFPLVVLTAPGRHIRHLSGPALLNVTLVERPVRFITLRSVVDSALRHRRHQYEIRDTLLELQRAHEELAQANRELESRVQERTARLTEALHELEGFSYSIAHDMRAPLRAMRGFARVILEDYSATIPDNGKSYLQRIESSADRMDQLITDILSYSRASSADIKLGPVDLRALISEVIGSYPALSQSHGNIELAGSFPPVIGNRAALTQVVSNILGNAVKFVPPGRAPKILVWAEPSENDQRVRIYFKDNGIGIEPRFQKQIFGMFERLHLQGTYEGTGIGLAIVRKVMQRMGGDVGVTSQPPDGSTFWIDLNRAPQAGSSAAKLL